MLIAGHERELITYMIKTEGSHPDTATPDAIEEYVRACSMPGGIRAMLSIYRAMLVDTEQNRQAARQKLDTTSPRKCPTRWPARSCRSWPGAFGPDR